MEDIIRKLHLLDLNKESRHTSLATSSKNITMKDLTRITLNLYKENQSLKLEIERLRNKRPIEKLHIPEWIS